MENSKEIYILFAVLALTLILGVYVILGYVNGKDKPLDNSNLANFQALTNNENNVEFQVTPLSSSEFQIAIDTHSVDLDFDLAEISMLYDDIGNEYKAIKWEGSEPGGHHRSGILKFPTVDKNAKLIKLVIKDSTAREFEWRQ